MRIRGSVEVHSLSLSNNEEPVLRIPFRATILHGSLDYDKDGTRFYIPTYATDSSVDKLQDCRPIKLINRFNSSIVIYNVTTDSSGLLLQYMNVNLFLKTFSDNRILRFIFK